MRNSVGECTKPGLQSDRTLVPDATASKLPSGEKARAVMGSRWYAIVAAHVQDSGVGAAGDEDDAAAEELPAADGPLPCCCCLR